MKKFITLLCCFLMLFTASCQLNKTEKSGNDSGDLTDGNVKNCEDTLDKKVNYDDINLINENKTGNQAKQQSDCML